MKNKSLEDNIIDMKYDEEYDKKLLQEHPEETNEFNSKLDALSGEMNKVNDIDFDLDVNFMSIIEKADNIKTEKHNTKELIYFVLTAFCILAGFAFFTFSLGTKFLMISQVIIAIISIVTLIFCIKKAYARGDRIR